MNTLTKSLLAATVVAGVATTAVFAANLMQDHFLGNWDENSDGKVTIEETTARRAALFTSFDANSDGFLDAGEMAMHDQMRAEQHKQMAENGMMRPGMGRGYGMGMHRGPGMGPGYGMGPRHGMGPGRGMGQGFGPPKMGQAGPGGHRMMDADGDNRISKAEFTGMGERWFARFDRNGDRVIDANDF